MQKRFFSPAEAAEILDVSSTTVMRLIHDGRLPALRVSERIYRIPVPAFERFQSGDVAVPFETEVRRTEAKPRIGADERLPELGGELAPEVDLVRP